MTGRHLVVPCLDRRRKLAALLLVLAASRGAAGDETWVRPAPRAREMAPGEIVRFEVATDPAVKGLEGRFFDSPITFAKASTASGAASWIGWGVIPLDAKAGSAPYRLSARRADGSSLSFDGAIDVLEKTFAEQRLDVEPKFVNPPKAELARIEREKKKLDAIYGRRTALPPAAAPFVRPVPGEPTSEFGTRRVFNGEPRAPHPGLDLHAVTGTPVLAAGAGRVALAESLYYSGGTVIVDHGEGLFTIYAHLSKIEAKVGAAVSAGDRLGLSGATGRVTGPHLHWGARVGGAIFDPRGLLDPRLFAAAP